MQWLRLFAVIAGVVLITLPGGVARSDGAAGRDESIILTIKGEIGAAVSGVPVTFDLESLKKFGPVTIVTSSPWLSGRARFKGILLRQLMESVEARAGGNILATAIDDYSAEIPWDDIANYDVLLAYEVNGVPLTRRDKGPLWVVYPIDEHPELATVDVNYRWIWQLISLEVQ